MAVKIINHDRHVGNNFDALRESVLCSNIQHPNVVMTYKVSIVEGIKGSFVKSLAAAVPVVALP